MGNSRKPDNEIKTKTKKKGFSSGSRKKNGKRRYHRGFYKIINTHKYMGNVDKCIYRSGWELKMFIYLDNNDKILRWASENITIIYHKPDKKNGSLKTHRYYPDIYYEMMINGDSNKLRRVVAEIKPYKETIPPQPPKKQTAKAYESFEYASKTYMTNLYKWDAAVKWCKKHQMEFVIIDERHLKANNIM